MLQNLPRFILKPLSRLVRAWPWLRRKVNAYAINGIVNVSRHRPHPWSTIHDYVSWDSLTDRQWSARHLPAVDEKHKPEVAELTRMFVRRPEGQVFCAKSTCLFPAFAQYLTDGFIRTRMPNTSAGEKENPTRLQNTSNHQIDLCTLYGRTHQQTTQLRVLSEQPGSKGRLKSQMISGEVYSPFLFESDGSRIKDEFNCLDVPLGIDRVASPEQRAKLFAAGGDRITDMAEELAIETTNLTKIYGSGNTEVVAMRNASVKVRRGEVIALLGPSGSGKSTFLTAVGLINAPTSGQVRIGGVLVMDGPVAKVNLRSFRREHNGFVFQKSNLIPFLTAIENVQIAMELNGLSASQARKRAAELLNELGVGDRLDHSTAMLSGGQQQRVAVARALANHPSVILADEPTAALDSHRGRQVMELFRNVAREHGAGVIVVTHDQRTLEVFDTIYEMEDGAIRHVPSHPSPVPIESAT
ncbi:MAG: ATP-binding cassette domain-containing protein [Planctomyces sp.]|nr:ATP-binding cassette domain-containing protein [Planctomyces sp.]